MKKLKALILISIFSFSCLYATYPKVALVLSGGGAKGFAQIPVVEGIQKLGIPIDFICGTSMGGLIGAYYAIGYNSSDLKQMVKENPLLDSLLYTSSSAYYSPTLFKDPDGIKLSVGLNSKGIGNLPGLLNDQGILSLLNKTTVKAPGEIDFKDLYIPFKAVSVDVTTGKEKILDHGFISDAMRATMSLPIIFPPFLLKDGTYCMDGGLVDNLPVQVAIDWGADIIISVDVSSDGLKTYEDFSTLSGIIIQTINLTTFSNREESQKASDIVILPDVGDYKVLDVGKFDEIFKKGAEAFELNKDEFIKIRDEISKYRPLEIKDKSAPSYYSEIQDPLVTGFEFIDITNNNKNYSFTNRFDKYVNNRLTQDNLESLEYDIQSFGRLNNISTVTYNFKVVDKDANSGVIEIGLRSWENSPSKIDFLALAKLGISSNPDNMAWLYFSFDIHSQIKEILAEKMAVDLKLNLSENTKVNAKIGYQFFSEQDKELTLFFQFGGEFGSLSPANNKFVKYYIPSFSVGFDVGMGLDYRLSNKFSTEFLLNYNLVSLSSTTFIDTSNQIFFEEPILKIVDLDLSFAYLNMSESIFATKGYGIDGIDSINITNGKFGLLSFTEGDYNIELTDKDSLKLNGSFGFSTANYQLTSSYFDLGGYKKLPGFYFGQFTREYFLLNLSYQRYLGEFIAPIYFQTGIKFFGYDSYNPIKNIHPSSSDPMLLKPNTTIPSIDNLGVGLFGALGVSTSFGDIIFGGGFSINGNFNIVVEFV